jgi:hypothetical protein
MKIGYTQHAKLRIRQRKISTTFIESALAAPDKTHLSFSKRIVARKSFNGKTLEIVYKKENATLIILTAYWL